MMFKVKYTTAACRDFEEKIVSGDVTIKEFVNDFGGHVGTLMFNGSTLQNDESTFEELAEVYRVPDGGSIILFDSPKTANA